MNWLFNFILNNNLLKRFIPKRDIDQQLGKEGQMAEKQSPCDYYDHLGNMY